MTYPDDLWQPQVRWSPDFARRLERFWERAGAAGRGVRRGLRPAGLRPEGPRASAHSQGAGYEFAGYRPYRPGEDLRHFDWSLYARSDAPFVRVHQAEAGERWCFVLDTRARMGVGRPSKLQRAAELALALAGVALARGHRVQLVWHAGGLRSSRRAELPAARQALGRLACDSAAAWGAVLRLADALDLDRMCVFGDLSGPPAADVLALSRPGRSVSVVSWMAPHELRAPPREDHARWVEPESGAEVRVDLDAATRARYAQLVDRELLQWRRACARRRIGFFASSTSTDFETRARELLRAWGDVG